MYTAEITPKPATVQIIRDTNQDIKSVIVQCDRHLKTTVLWWQLGRGREMLLLCFGWETETYCKLKRFSRELPVHLPFEDPIPQGRWCAGCDGPDSPRRVLYLLYKALTQKNKWDMLHEAHHLEQVRSVWDKLSQFLSDWETKEDDNRKPTVPDSVQHLLQLKGLLLSGSVTMRKGGCMSLPPQLSFKPHSRALEEPEMPCPHRWAQVCCSLSSSWFIPGDPLPANQPPIKLLDVGVKIGADSLKPLRGTVHTSILH